MEIEIKDEKESYQWTDIDLRTLYKLHNYSNVMIIAIYHILFFLLIVALCILLVYFLIKIGALDSWMIWYEYARGVIGYTR